MIAEKSETIHLCNADVSVVLDVSGGAIPRVAYWGSKLDLVSNVDLDSLALLNIQPWAANTLDATPQVGILPEASRGWLGSPGLMGSRAGKGWSPKFEVTEVEVETGSGTERATFTAADIAAELEVFIVVELLTSGLLRVRGNVTNKASETYQLDRMTLSLPVPDNANEILDHAGRWAKERVPQRTAFNVGTHLRENLRGKTGHDAAFMTVLGAEGFSFQSGDVRGIHLAWSGNARIACERLFSGERVISAGEALMPGEIQLAPGESYETPWIYGSYSHQGMDRMSARYHHYLRGLENRATKPRPVTINVWEAVYFDHRLDRLVDLAERSAALGVERYILDDGWFGSRRDDTKGLGDWFVAEEVWPGDTLKQLADKVHELGMEFGIWFEPEMINPDSELARNHPEWILQPEGHMPIEARNQQVLNIAIPEAFDYIYDSICKIVDEYGVDYIKWDHNRDLVESGNQLSGRAGVHEQTLAFYALVDKLKESYPALEIESCSGGGARIDLGVLERTDRVWTSDCIDAFERQDIQRWTGQLLPPELMGSHVGDGVAHTTGRMHDIDFRAGTALFGHFGIEWDLARATEDELASLREWIGIYKSFRSLIHSGTVVRQDTDGSGLYVHGVVSEDKSEALYAFVTMERTISWPPGRLTLPGLDPEKTYELEPVKVGRHHDPARQLPQWWGANLKVSGQVLSQAGLFPPALHPENLAVLSVKEVR